MTDPVDLLTSKIKEIYISKDIMDLKEQMEAADKLNREILGYLKMFIDLDFFSVTDINDLFYLYSNMEDYEQEYLILRINSYCINYYDSHNKYGKKIIDEFLAALEDNDSDYVIDDEEYARVMNEDMILDDIEDEIAEEDI